MSDSILYVVSLSLGAMGAWLVATFAEVLGLVDLPNQRSSHVKPTPKGGGIGILLGFVCVAAVLRLPLTMWMPATLISCLSLLGDRIEISVKIRLVAQLAAAITLLVPGPLAGSLAVSCPFPYGVCLLVLCVFIAGTANFYNFMDGINGISAVTGIVGFGLFAFYTCLANSSDRMTTLSICVALSCVGFLPFNMPRARVFMGDVGAILLGFIFAATVVQLSTSILEFACLVAFLFPYYADELTTMAVRIRQRDQLTQAHRRHFYQLLANEKGIAHWKISTGYGIAQLLIGLAVLALKPFGLTAILAVLTLFFSAFILANLRLRSSIDQ